MNYLQKAEQFFKLVERSRNILVVSHQKPDGDTLGANLALLHYLEKLNKRYSSFCVNGLPQEFNFLPLSFKVSGDINIFQEPFDLIIVLDCGDLCYAGVEQEIKNIVSNYVLINIDHHPTNERFGHLNIVDDTAASTTEIMYNLFKSYQIGIDKEMATCLLTGICTDTSNFANPATTHSVLQASAKLLTHGANFHCIVQNTLGGQSVDILKLWGRTLSRLQLNDFGIAVTVVTQNDLKEKNLDEEAVSGVANFLNNLHGVKAVLVLKETADRQVRGSFRTSLDDIDVSKLARFFGGGGHKKAAGFSIPGKLVCNEQGCWQVV